MIVRALKTPISIRAFTMPDKMPLAQKRAGGSDSIVSDWQVIFDTETTRCPAQKLRFVCVQVRKSGQLVREIMVPADDLPSADLDVLVEYARLQGLEICSWMICAKGLL